MVGRAAETSKKERTKASGKAKERIAEQMVAQNRSANYHYELLERFEAGMVLQRHGSEGFAGGEGQYPRGLCAGSQGRTVAGELPYIGVQRRRAVESFSSGFAQAFDAQGGDPKDIR